LSDWGSEWGDFENSIDVSSDYEPPLSYELLSWNTGLEFDLSTFDGVSSIRISFGGDFTNGGYVVVDNVSITGTVDDLGLEPNEPNELLNVYPNPTSGEINIEFNKAFEGQLELYSMLGQLVESIEVDNMNLIQLDLSHLEKGLYTVALSDEEGEKRMQTISIN